MWIEKTKSGLRAVERYKVNGKWKRLTVPIEKDTPQARRRAMEALEEKSKATTQDATDTPLNRLAELYLEKKDCRESTRISLRGQFKNVYKIIDPETSIKELTSRSVRRMFLTSDLPPQTVNRAMAAFRTFASWLSDLEYTEENIGSKLTPIKYLTKEKDPETLYLEPDRLKDILSNLSGMPYYMTRFLALTGLRIGEAAALTTEDLDERYIHITKAYSDHSHTITAPKNPTSVRDIYVQPELRELLSEYLEWRRLDMMAYGIRPATLFYSRTGTIYQERYYRAVLHKFGVHPHMLRHTHVALLAEQGMTLEAIARRLGHSGTAITRKVYYHVTEKQKAKDEKAMEAIRIFCH